MVCFYSALNLFYPESSPAETTILNFALTLEHLEDAFFSGGISQFSEKDFLHAGFPPFVRGRFAEVAQHEHDHVLFLEGVLGDQATKPCTYKLFVVFFFLPLLCSGSDHLW
jgi:hypothetical protein